MSTQISISPFRLALEVRNRWSLISQLTHREAFAKYKHSIFGSLWSFLTPLFLLAIYTIVFSEIFKTKWPSSQSDSKFEFAVILFSGLSVFNFFSECLSKAPNLVLANPNYVKKLVFPLELLPIVLILSASINLGISIAILLVFQYFLLGVFHWTALLLPIILIPLYLTTLGMGWFLASVGVYIRDIGQTIGIVITSLLFLSPVFFPTTVLPEKWQYFVNFNPVALPVEQSRAVLVFGQQPNWHLWGITLAISIAVFFLGYAWFQVTRRGFADVI